MAQYPKSQSNYCFIDGQNLHLGTTKAQKPWRVDYKRLRIYLKDKYHISKAYYFLGYREDKHHSMYQALQECGYIVIFKDHMHLQTSKKKGNVDIDIVFEVMKKLLEESDYFHNIALITGDGDFKKLIDFLIKKQRFLKIFFPNRNKRSSLYRTLSGKYTEHLENVRTKIERGFT